MKIIKFGFRLVIYDSKHQKFTFMNNRLMNARQFWFLTKNKTIQITIPMPSLFYQVWNKEKGWQEDYPTMYNKIFTKINSNFKLKNQLK